MISLFSTELFLLLEGLCVTFFFIKALRHVCGGPKVSQLKMRTSAREYQHSPW